jgi:hypothetical protein
MERSLARQPTSDPKPYPITVRLSHPRHPPDTHRTSPLAHSCRISPHQQPLAASDRAHQGTRCSATFHVGARRNPQGNRTLTRREEPKPESAFPAPSERSAVFHVQTLAMPFQIHLNPLQLHAVASDAISPPAYPAGNDRRAIFRHRNLVCLSFPPLSEPAL